MRKKMFTAGSAITLCMIGFITAVPAAAAQSAENKPELKMESAKHIKDEICLAGISSVMSQYLSEICDGSGDPAADGAVRLGDCTAVDVDRAETDGMHSVGVDAEIASYAEELARDDIWRIVSSGVNAVAAGYIFEDPAQEVSITFEERGLQAAPNVENTAENTEKKKSESAKEEKEWKNYLMADVNEYLNIRASKKDDAKVVGKLRKGDRAVVKKYGNEWTKIASGAVEGYVKTEHCVIGKDALEYAKRKCGTVAVVDTDSLRVRAKRSTGAKVVATMDRGEHLKVKGKAKQEKGWIAVKTETGDGYVRAEYVTLTYDTSKAISVEEEEEKAAEAAAESAESDKDKREETSSKSSETKTSGSKRRHRSSLAASADDETLLAALIYCEAGGENYDCQLAVGSVVVNRVHSGSFPNSLRRVIYQGGQFGPASSGKLERVLAGGVSSKSKRAAAEALSGVDNTDGCLYFNDVGSTGHRGKQIDTMMFW